VVLVLVHTWAAVCGGIQFSKFKRFLGHFTLGVKAKVELKLSIPIHAITEIGRKGFTL
jgi:hypothetical protein